MKGKSTPPKGMHKMPNGKIMANSAMKGMPMMKAVASKKRKGK